jgi:hypothetical protein
MGKDSVSEEWSGRWRPFEMVLYTRCAIYIYSSPSVAPKIKPDATLADNRATRGMYAITAAVGD